MIAPREACISFRLGSEGFGLRIDTVAEVVPVGHITPVPLAPPAIRGLVNLRGRVVTLFSVAELLERPLPQARLAEDRLALVLASPHHHLGLYIHAPVEIGAAAPQRVMTGHASGGSGERGANGIDEDAPDDSVGGPAEMGGAVLHLLSVPELVARCERIVIEGFREKR